MSTLITLAELRRRSVDLRFHEAVALAQKLIHADVDSSSAQAPFGPLSPETVALDRAGRVHCLGCATTPSVTEIGLFLQGLLDGKTLPGGLRYAIGRALLEVEAPPFDSLASFSIALQRFEIGDRDDVIRGLVARAEATSGFAAVRVRRPPDRRRRGPTISDLRRELRQADLSLYEAVRARRTALRRTSLRAAYRRGPFFACVFAGLTLIAAGQFADSREVDNVRTGRRVAARDIPLAADPRERTAEALRTRPFSAAAAETSEAAHVRPSTTEASSDRRASARSSARGVSTRPPVTRTRNTPRRAQAAAPNTRRVAPPPVAASSPPAADRERSDDGLLRIRFEWDNPFKRTH